MWFGSLGGGGTNKTEGLVNCFLCKMKCRMKDLLTTHASTLKPQVSQAMEDWGVCTPLVALEEVSAAEAGWVEVPTESHFEYPAPHGSW